MNVEKVYVVTARNMNTGVSSILSVYVTLSGAIEAAFEFIEPDEDFALGIVKKLADRRYAYADEYEVRIIEKMLSK